MVNWVMGVGLHSVEAGLRTLISKSTIDGFDAPPSCCKRPSFTVAKNP
jgi:hypothetical protein